MVDTTDSSPLEQQLTATIATAEARRHQINSVATILFPDLAQDLQLLTKMQERKRSAGLDATSTVPLVQDLLQRPIHEVSPTRLVFTPPPANMEACVAQRKRLSAEEKGKEVEGRQSRPPLQYGESSVAFNWMKKRIEGPHLHNERSRHQEEVQKNQRPLLHTTPRPSSHGQLHLDEQGFSEVKPPYWWRKEKLHSRGSSEPRQPMVTEQGRKKFLSHVQGKCLNCFSTDHRVAHCRNSTKCWKCLNSGHRAFYCPAYKQPQYTAPATPIQQQTSTQFFHPRASTPATPTQDMASPQFSYTQDTRTYLQVARGDPALMAYSCNTQARLDRSRCVSNRDGWNLHPHRDDPDDDHRRGTRCHHGSSDWSRMSHYRGVVDDGYSSTWFRGENYGQFNNHSRRLSPLPSWGHGGKSQSKKNMKWIIKTKTKKVSFATPLVHVFGELTTDASLMFTGIEVYHDNRYDPMLEESLLPHVPLGPTKVIPTGPSKEDYIKKMLSTHDGSRWPPH
jgi:hypothetical protein